MGTSDWNINRVPVAGWDFSSFAYQAAALALHVLSVVLVKVVGPELLQALFASKIIVVPWHVSVILTCGANEIMVRHFVSLYLLVGPFGAS